jgi:hypothetical protein
MRTLPSIVTTISKWASADEIQVASICTATGLHRWMQELTLDRRCQWQLVKAKSHATPLGIHFGLFTRVMAP